MHIQVERARHALGKMSRMRSVFLYRLVAF